ncbi:MAG TPA: ABC transporter ATP-binding protein [Candidatus Cloacimonadota bacterium]|nr:ABC transporter ATP-binding protein [Candidatus Cloacimonadota bacterium]
MKNIVKNYHVGDVVVHALRGVDLNIKEGEFVAIMGASGSGKSTLMNILGCLDTATNGDYFLDELNVNSLNKDQYADIRNQKIGFVFQGFNLLPRTTALENVELPLLYDRKERIKNPREQAIKALQSVGLKERLDHVPNQLSGGQQQRVAVARALVNNPAIILADEPTGNLDTRTSVDVMSVFQRLNKEGKTIIVVTHEPDIAQFAKRNIKLRDGKIIEDVQIAVPQKADEILAALIGDEDEVV